MKKKDNITFTNLEEKERKILLELLGVSIRNMKCKYCHKEVTYKNCSILPTGRKKDHTIIACSSPLCLSTYMTEELEDGAKVDERDIYK